MGHARGRRGVVIVLAFSALPLVQHGCSSPTATPPPPDGGVELVLDFDRYVSDVAPVLEQHGCSAGGDCHGGGPRGTFELSPAGDPDRPFDFAQVALQVRATDFATSPILTEPLALAAGGTPHGVKPFATTSDSGYAAILAWIEDGVVR